MSKIFGIYIAFSVVLRLGPALFVHRPKINVNAKEFNNIFIFLRTPRKKILNAEGGGGWGPVNSCAPPRLTARWRDTGESGLASSASELNWSHPRVSPAPKRSETNNTTLTQFSVGLLTLAI